MPQYEVAVALYKQVDDTRSQLVGINRKYTLDTEVKADELYYKFESRLKTQLEKIESRTLPAGSVFNWITLKADGSVIREAIYANRT